MLFYLMLYVHIYCIYLMLFAALFNAVCLYNTCFFLPLIFANAFCFHALSWVISNIILHHAQCY